MAAAAHELAEEHAEVPKEWGRNLVACLTCKLVKTQEQVIASELISDMSVMMEGRWAPVGTLQITRIPV